MNYEGIKTRFEMIDENELAKVIEKATASYSTELTKWVSQESAKAVIQYLESIGIVNVLNSENKIS